MAGRPATLEGSLLARKGDATPAIPDDSPLTESLEAATSDIVPLHRVEPSEAEPEQATLAPTAVRTARPVSPRRRAAIILVALLVLCLIVVALASGGTRSDSKPVPPPPARETGAVTAPAPVAPEMAAVAPPESPAAQAAPPAAAAPLKKPLKVTPVLAPVSPAQRYVLQFASVRGERQAAREAIRLQKRLGPVLDGRKIAVVGSKVSGVRRYRLRAGSYGSLRAAKTICRRVEIFKVECLPIRR
jgi:hypothetical protein